MVPTTTARAVRLVVCLALLAGGLGAPYAAAGAAGAAPASACLPVPTGVRLADPQVAAGDRVFGRVLLSCAPAQLVAVSLVGFPGAGVPGAIAVPAGEQGARFVVATVPESPLGSGRVTATLGGVSASAPLTIVEQTSPGCDPELTRFAVPNRVRALEEFTVRLQVSCRRWPAEGIYLESSANLQVEGSGLVSLPAFGIGPVSVTVRAVSTGDGLQPGWISARRSDQPDSPAVVEPVVVAPGLAQVRVPRRHVYWDEERLLEITLTGVAPPGGQVVDVVSSRPDVVESRRVRVPADVRRVEVPLTVHEPSLDAEVRLTATLGTRAVRRTTTVHPRPVYSSVAVSLQADPFQPLNSRDTHVAFPVHVDRAVDFAGLWVDLTSDQPTVFPAQRVQILPGDHDRTAYAALGPAAATTDVTVTATVEGHPGLTGSVTFTVHPGVATIDTPATVTEGQTFPVTVHLQGPASIDQALWFHPNFARCRPSEPTLRAGVTELTATCTAVDFDPAPAPGPVYVMSIWLDQDFNLSVPVSVLGRPG